jgi:hypothetical protein
VRTDDARASLRSGGIDVTRRIALGLLFALTFLVNPHLVACSSAFADGDDADFTYSEADMRAAVLGDWQGTAELDGETTAFTLTLRQASATPSGQGLVAPPVRPQCGLRTFVAPAAACASISTMVLAGTITSDHPRLTGSVTGELEAFRTLDSSLLGIELPDRTELRGSLERQAIADGGIYGETKLGTFTLARP